MFQIFTNLINLRIRKYVFYFSLNLRNQHITGVAKFNRFILMVIIGFVIHEEAAEIIQNIKEPIGVICKFLNENFINVKYSCLREIQDREILPAQ